MIFEHYDYENKIPLDKLYDELDLIYEFYENKKFDRKNIDKKSKDYVSLIYNMKEYKMLVAYKDNMLIGFINYYYKDDNYIMLSEIQIRNDYRNKGILRELFKELINNNKCNGFYCTINPNNKNSYDVFTYIGFKKIDDRLYKINYRTFNKWLNKGL